MTDPITIPDRAPLYPQMPYPYVGYRKLSAFCRTDSQAIARAMPEGLDPVSDVMEVFVMDVPDGGQLGAYKEGGIVLPCRHRDALGGHVLYELVTTDDSLCVGREIWGYPKKLAEVDWIERDGGSILGTVTRRGQRLIDLSFAPGEAAFEKPQMQPRFQVKRFPRVDGAGFDVDQIILNAVTGIEVATQLTGTCEVALGGNDDDPLHELTVLDVIGAEFVTGSFVLGAGEVVEDRLRP